MPVTSLPIKGRGSTALRARGRQAGRSGVKRERIATFWYCNLFGTAPEVPLLAARVIENW